MAAKKKVKPMSTDIMPKMGPAPSKGLKGPVGKQFGRKKGK